MLGKRKALCHPQGTLVFQREISHTVLAAFKEKTGSQRIVMGGTTWVA